MDSDHQVEDVRSIGHSDGTGKNEFDARGWGRLTECRNDEQSNEDGPQNDSQRQSGRAGAVGKAASQYEHHAGDHSASHCRQ